jgi:flagellar P-ring protein precursor FlgI
MRPIIASILFFLFCDASFASARIKDITFPQGTRDFQLIGYGVVVGLQGTGDTLRNSPFTEQSLSSMLDRMGVNIRSNLMRTRNLAAVMVTASLPPFIGWGSTIDVTVSSLGDATSLMGGTLLLTSLSGVDGNIYALAQGPIAISGFSATGQNETLTHGVATVGRIPNGATIEREPPRTSSGGGTLALELRNPDFETCVRIADAINEFSRKHFRIKTARERDSRSLSLTVPSGVSTTRFLAKIGELRVSPVALTHGGLTVRITETPEVSQPAPFSRGRTVVTSQTMITASEPTGQVATLDGRSLRSLVKGLNQVGLKPTGIISILQAIKNAGALQADLVIQ